MKRVISVVLAVLVVCSFGGFAQKPFLLDPLLLLFLGRQVGYRCRSRV